MALRYAALALPVFPLRQGSKRPATGHGVLDATTDPAKITGWWDGSPMLNIGIATGRASGGLFITDLDRKNGVDGVASFTSWLAENGLALPPGPWLDTPSGGVHVPMLSDGRPVQSRAGVLPGVDIRGDGGYIATWPSGIELPMGRQHPGDPPPERLDRVFVQYRWHGCPCQIPVTPPELLDAQDGLHGSGNGGGEGGTWDTGLAELPPTGVLLEHGVPHPHDVNLTRLAARLAGAGKSWEEAHPVLRRVADITAIAEPWPDGNLHHKWASARGKGFGQVPPEAMAWAQGAAGGQGAPQPGGDPQSAQMAAREARLELDRHNSTWLYGHDINQLDFILCVAIAGGSTEDGERLWGIVVNASSSAKSEGIKMLFGVANKRLSDLTAAGLISWIGTGKNMRVTGLLTKLPSPAFVLIEDLAPILSDTADTRNRSKLVAILRKVYDGEVQRDLGGTPGQAAWSGKVTVLAASTKVIDQQSALLDEAGPRWLLYRGKETGAGNRLSGTGRRINSRQRAEARQRARELATAVVRHGRAAFASMELSDQAAGTLGDIAVAVGILRGSVPRDGYRRDITGIATTEEPWRLEAQLQLLSRAAMAFGHTETSAVTLARTVALGTVSPDRMKVMEVLSQGGQHTATASSIGREKEIHRHVARRALEDLQQLRVTQCTNEDPVSDDPLATGLAKNWCLAGTDEAGVTSQVIRDGGVGTKTDRYRHLHT